MIEFENNSVSLFLLQAILASVASYPSLDMIKDAGFENHLVAQKTFFKRACLICDLGAESRQLRLLQGSLVLSLLNFSFAIDKDYRFWLSNSVRIATQIGLHRDNVAKDLDLSTRGLFRRLWWIIYYRDALLVSNGLNNVRRIHDSDFDTAALDISDWEEETIPDRFAHVLPSITTLQKVFLIESCKLSRIGGSSSRPEKHADICPGAQYVEISRDTEPAASDEAWLQLEETLLRWRKDLPTEMHIERVHEWSVSNIWPLVLLARSYLLECIMYRMIRNNHRAASGVSTPIARAIRRLPTAIFELDTIVDRIMLHDLARFCPLYL